MLAEYYETDFYKELPNHLDSEGKWNEVPEILADIKAMIEEQKAIEGKERWYDLNKIWKWLYYDPEITDKDLRPYYYACKEKSDYFSSTANKNDLSEIVDLLFRDEMAIVGRTDGLILLVQNKTELRKNLVGYIDAIPADKAGVWIIQGWDKAIPKDCDERKKLNQYFEKLKNSGTKIVKSTLRNM